MNAIALVVGNSDYESERNKLDNAVNDAEDFGAKLEQLGFVVKLVKDCKIDDFCIIATEFVQEANKYDVCLFYFSGHGVQIKGENYLTFIDTQFVEGYQFQRSSFCLKDLLNDVNASSSKMNIFILDACRNNPFPERGGLNIGLAPIFAPKGTLIAFSTSPGETAMDGGAGRNSIYTGALLNHIDDEKISIEDFFKRVRTSVYTLSNEKQTSWEHTSLIGPFCFNYGQLVHSIGLPYKQECIADENFQSTGSEIDSIIDKLKSYDWYTQNPAIDRFCNLDATKLDKSDLFLFGRNLLQTAVGGENRAKYIFNNLCDWLLPYGTESENHIFNGILYEIYFDSKGHFRQNNFKSDLLDKVLILTVNGNYKSSFDFIQKQLSPYRDYIFFMPGETETSIPIEVMFADEMEQGFMDRPNMVKELISVKHEGVELYKRGKGHHFGYYEYKDLKEQISKDLCIPINKLTLSNNLELSDNDSVYVPLWDLNLSRKMN